jgi:hypothetical protein
MKKKSVQISIIIFVLLLVKSNLLAQVQTDLTVSIRNNSEMLYSQTVVEIPWSDVIKQNAHIDTSKLVVLDEKGTQLAMQFETKGTGKLQNLLVELTINANTTRKIRITTGIRKKFPTKTFCRFVPERFDDFAWENDKIAFRMYGKALESTKFNALGVDVWAKRTPNMIIDKWYKTEDYHNDHGEGLDFYSVGNTLGAGGCAPFVGDSIYHSKNYTRYEVLDNGPLRSTFKLFYEPWVVAGHKVSAVKTIQLSAGEQLSKIDAQFEFEGVDSLPIAIGINTKTGKDVKIIDAKNSILAYWLPNVSEKGTIGVGCISTATNQKMLESNGHLISFQFIPKNTQIVYYAGAVWDKAGEIHNEIEWYKYLQTFSLKLANKLEISVK